MTEKINRRDFLKLAAVGAGATAILTGCGPASRYVVREPYTQMPEYTYNGQSTYYATTCRECPAGCGIVVRTHQGRAIKIEGNPRHPLNQGRTCARGQAALQGLYNPDRVTGPVRQNGRGSGSFTSLTWEQAISAVKEALTNNEPSEIAFLFGLAPDHLYDLAKEITTALGSLSPYRQGAFGILEARNTLAEAAKRTLGKRSLPVFDLAHADVAFSFGADFLGTWISPVAYSLGYASLRQGVPGRRGYMVHFESRLSQTGARADERVPIIAGSEGQLALAIGRLAAEARGLAIPAPYLNVDIAAAAQAAGIQEERLRRLANTFAEAEHPLAIPGGAALGGSNGLETAQAVLMLNSLADNLGKPGGVFFTPELPVHAENSRLPNSIVDLAGLVDKMKAGKIKVLFVHGVNPLFEFPAALDFAGAMANVPLVISFASFPDESAAQADFILPDHTPLESWGYQVPAPAADRAVLSASQPVVVPFYDTRATADVLLAAVQATGGGLAAAVPYKDEVEFLQHSLLSLVSESAGYFNAPEINTFWAQWQQFGGWWTEQAKLDTPNASSALNRGLALPGMEVSGDGEFLLHIYPSTLMGDGSGANKPWLQETPDPMTTVMWNSWVEINPINAVEMGLEDDDVVRIISPFGEIEASVYRYPPIRQEVAAIPFGQGHTALGRYAQQRGANPLQLLGIRNNGAGDLIFEAVKVRLEKTGKKRELARKESKLGIYSE
jgi:anaerobic selenocysteine-containing dehydrogenase